MTFWKYTSTGTFYIYSIFSDVFIWRQKGARWQLIQGVTAMPRNCLRWKKRDALAKFYCGVSLKNDIINLCAVLPWSHTNCGSKKFNGVIISLSMWESTLWKEFSSFKRFHCVFPVHLSGSMQLTALILGRALLLKWTPNLTRWGRWKWKQSLGGKVCRSRSVQTFRWPGGGLKR